MPRGCTIGAIYIKKIFLERFVTHILKPTRCVSVSKIKGIKKRRGGFIRSSPFLLRNGRGDDMKSNIS